MKLVIVSDLVGTPGEEFVPAEGINVEALLEGGFIKTEKPTKEKSED
jgi:hypothetical protein